MKAPLNIDGIICFSTDPWGEMKRPGQLMLRLSELQPVVYVEPYLSLTSIVKNWRTIFSAATRNRLRRAFTRCPAEIRPNLTVVTQLVLIPPHRLSSVLPDSLVEIIVRNQHVKASRRAYRAARCAGVSAPVMWVSYPLVVPDTPDGERSVLVYDCMDRWTDFPNMMSDASWRKLIGDQEQALVERADVVLCSAEGLFEAKRRVAVGRTHLVRNGADVEHFAPSGRSVPGDIAQLPHPMLGYVGAVAEWVDFDLLRSVALLRPEWSIVLVGPVFQGQTMGDVRALRLVEDLPNVHLLGARPYDDVPAYLEAFDVAMIPFKINGLTEDTNPIKVYEYLAAGVPVVSTPLPEVATLPEVQLASNADAFVQACAVALDTRWDEDRLTLRRDVAAENSWRTRADIAWRAVLECQAVLEEAREEAI